MVVLNVSVSDTGQRGLIQANREVTKGKGSSFMLYRHIPRLGVIPSPVPDGGLLLKPWIRINGGLEETIDLTKV
jgi:hypothetical protein